MTTRLGKMTRRAFISRLAGACGYAAISPLVGRARALAFSRSQAAATSGISWPQNHALPSFATPVQLDAADITSLTNDQQLMLASLQGIVNRRQPRIYLLQSGDNTDQLWLETIDIPSNVVADPLSLVSQYSGEAAGAVIYDLNVPDTVNVATSLAGVMGGMIASGDLASEYNLPVLADLRGQFATKFDAYGWILDNYWTQLTPRMLTAISPTTTNLRDYIVATQALVFWLDPDVKEEAALFAQILQRVRPDTPYMGWFVDGHEAPGVTLCSQNGVVVGAADFLDNATVLGGIASPIRDSQPQAATPTLEKKIYVTFTFSDGDNLQYDQHRLRTIWDDPNRGLVPINWSISPLLKDVAPPILNYYQTTQTPNDFMVAGPSGAGYTYPSDWRASALASYAKRTGQYMAAAGLNVIDALNLNEQGLNLAFSKTAARDYVLYAKPLGVLGNWELGAGSLQKVAGLPIVTQAFVLDVADGLAVLDGVAASWNGKHPLFVAILIDAWNLAPTDVYTMASTLSAKFESVRADTFFELMRKS